MSSSHFLSRGGQEYQYDPVARLENVLLGVHVDLEVGIQAVKVADLHALLPFGRLSEPEVHS